VLPCPAVVPLRQSLDVNLVLVDRSCRDDLLGTLIEPGTTTIQSTLPISDGGFAL